MSMKDLSSSGSECISKRAWSHLLPASRHHARIQQASMKELYAAEISDGHWIVEAFDISTRKGRQVWSSHGFEVSNRGYYELHWADRHVYSS